MAAGSFIGVLPPHAPRPKSHGPRLDSHQTQTHFRTL